MIYGSDTTSPLSQTVYVKVADVGNGRLTATKVEDESGTATTDEPAFTNNVTIGNLKVTATALGLNEHSVDTEIGFVIRLNDAAGNPISGNFPIAYYHADGTKNEKVYPDGENEGETITEVSFGNGFAEGLFNNKSGEYFIISGLPAGTTYELYLVLAINQAFTQTAATNTTGTIEANKTIEAGYTVTYGVEGNVTLQANTTLVNADNNDESMIGYIFTLQLYDEDNNLLQTKKSDSSTGSVTFDPIVFSASDAGTKDNPKVHRYRIAEVNDHQRDIVYDTHSGWVTVEVYDETALTSSVDTGKLNITATYEHANAKADTTPETFANKYKISVAIPYVGGSGLAIPFTIAVIVVTAGAAWRMRKKR